MIARLLKRSSSNSAMKASLIFLSSDFSGVRNMFFASCWVNVLPPCTVLPASRFASRARTMDFRLSPWC